LAVEHLISPVGLVCRWMIRSRVWRSVTSG